MVSDSGGARFKRPYVRIGIAQAIHVHVNMYRVTYLHELAARRMWAESENINIVSSRYFKQFGRDL